MKLYEYYSINSTCISRMYQILMDLMTVSTRPLQCYSTADGLHYCEPLYIYEVYYLLYIYTYIPHNIVVSYIFGVYYLLYTQPYYTQECIDRLQ